MLGGREFFYGLGIRGVDELIDRAYDVAWFWRLDPEVVMERSIVRLAEVMGQVGRIIEEAGDGG